MPSKVKVYLKVSLIKTHTPIVTNSLYVTNSHLGHSPEESWDYFDRPSLKVYMALLQEKNVCSIEEWCLGHSRWYFYETTPPRKLFISRMFHLMMPNTIFVDPKLPLLLFILWRTDGQDEVVVLSQDQETGPDGASCSQPQSLILNCNDYNGHISSGTTSGHTAWW